MSYITSPHEEQRLERLRQLDILDTLREEAFDFITDIAVKLFDTPIALISLIDQDRQWFKSRVGLEVSQTPRDQAFCNYTILSDEVMIVPDASEDERFKSNPLVLQDPNIRFYAGAPIILDDNIRVGAVCIIDHQSRQIELQELQLLQSLANQVSTLLKLREVSSKLRLQEQENRQLQHLLPICSWCKKIRRDRDYWDEIESVVSELTESELTHAICPDCSDNLHAEMDATFAEKLNEERSKIKKTSFLRD